MISNPLDKLITTKPLLPPTGKIFKLNLKYFTLMHLHSRGLAESNKYDVRIAENESAATFMLYGVRDFLENKTNIKPLGYQTYKYNLKEKRTNDPRNSRYFTYQPRCSLIDDVVVFGLETLFTKPNLLFISEGIFEAANLHRLGYHAIAVLTSDPNKRLMAYLSDLANEYVWCGDNDKAGNNSWLANVCRYRLAFDKDLDEVDDQTIIDAINTLRG